MKNFLKLNFYVLVLLTLISSCKKGKDGEMGPQGPQGLQGAQGVPGVTGTANVIYSDWETIEAEDWVGNPEFPEVVVYEKSVPAISADILDKGTVHVYYRISDANLVHALPYTYSDFGVTTVYNAGLDLGTIVFRITSTSAVVPGDGEFRYVIIPGGNALKATLDYEDYEAVASYYGLDK